VERHGYLWFVHTFIVINFRSVSRRHNWPLTAHFTITVCVQNTRIPGSKIEQYAQFLSPLVVAQFPFHVRFGLDQHNPLSILTSIRTTLRLSFSKQWLSFSLNYFIDACFFGVLLANEDTDSPVGFVVTTFTYRARPQSSLSYHSVDMAFCTALCTTTFRPSFRAFLNLSPTSRCFHPNILTKSWAGDS